MSVAAGSGKRAERRLAAGQGIFYAATGVWPLPALARGAARAIRTARAEGEP